MRPNKKIEILIVNNAKPDITEFVKPLKNIVCEMGFSDVSLEYADCINYDLSTVDGILLSGSPQGNDIVKHHLPYFNWLKTNKKPVLGICAGHHISGYLFGSKLLRSEEPESGDFEIETVKEDPLFTGLPQKFIVKQMHNDSVSLPNDFELLATSEICKNQVMKHKRKPLYTCQFHPEYYNHKLIQNFLEIVGKASLQAD